MSVETETSEELKSARRKRLADLLLAVIGAPIALPICAFAALAVRLETPGSPVFAQQRVGKSQEPITVYKLRTMHRDTGDLPSHTVAASNITKVGSLLRTTKVDELPQLWNVLKGEMSFVGPRPCLPSQTELIAERESRGIFQLVPGITGPSQLAGIDMSTPVVLADSDATYRDQRSLSFDIRCIVMTALGRGSGDAAGKLQAEAH